MTAPEEARPPELAADVIRRAERVLSRRFGGRPRILDHEALAGRAFVFRCRVEGRGAPESVIVKQPRPVEDKPYDHRDLSFRSPAWFLTTDWAGLELLDVRQNADGGQQVAPHFYGGDLARGLLVIEDLGDGESLADVLLGDNAAKAEEALVAYGRALGRMHAMTAGLSDDYGAILESLGRSGREREMWNGRLRSEIAKLPETCSELEFEWSPGMVDDVQQTAASLLEPGPFEAYIHGHPCPDNDRLLGGHMLFFDFDSGAFHNALIDGSYGRVPFPTCWCVNRLPDHLVPKFETAYRLELMKGVPKAGDDALFEKSLIEAAGYWLIENANALLPRALRLEQRWGISTYRQRLLYRFEAFSRMSARSRELEALGAWAYLMHERMRAKWPEVQDMSLYPAFRQDPRR